TGSFRKFMELSSENTISGQHEIISAPAEDLKTDQHEVPAPPPETEEVAQQEVASAPVEESNQFDDIDIEPITGSQPLPEWPTPEGNGEQIEEQEPEPAIFPTQSRAIKSRAGATRLILVRKLTNDRSANRELERLYEKFVDVCNEYQGPKPMPLFEEFKFLI